MLPHFFVIGAAKCGTTSLSSYLAEHPEIQLSKLTETRFFAPENPTRPYPGTRIARLSDYEGLFDAQQLLRGEVCGAYSQHPWRSGAAERIHELIPAARFVYLVGDPVRRVESHYVQTVAEEGETRPIATALGNIETHDHPAVCPGRYAQQLERYLALFPQERILVIDSDELLEEREQTLSQIFSFLGVDPAFRSEAFSQTRNLSSDHRRLSSGLYGRLRSGPLRQGLAALPPPLRERLVGRARRSLTTEIPRPALESTLRERLEEHFAPEAERLREMTGKSFAGWSV
jgi:Sulfotransferase family